MGWTKWAARWPTVQPAHSVSDRHWASSRVSRKSAIISRLLVVRA
jgi:hypothetical protein